MNRSDLIEQLARRFPQLLLEDAHLAVKTILDTMAKAISSDKRIEIRGFGSFDLIYRKPRVSRNPKSGKRVEVPAKYAPHFRAGRMLRERVDADK